METVVKWFSILFGSTVVLFLCYIFIMIGVDIIADHHSEENYSAPIYSIENNTVIQKQLSGKVYRDVEINRYNYTVKENGEYVVYYISYDDVSITETNGEEKIVFYKGVYDNPILDKYFTPSVRYKSRFYLHKSTIEKLGINVN